ncbi:hypothetical protein [Paenibacillus sp. OV219]|uniref:hypothetical protein n=1 Tax=Paenibacillus sp. OV219 TaxID=1884377 RepID=UPI0008BA7CCB|nr:hypothetical protein [Paenibacillus sp. OV219]SEO81696.1 hypothetical protein SAMN05518847_11181 [Paenibacillus sp. OV219]
MQQMIIVMALLFVGYRIFRRVRSNFSWSALRPRRLGFRMVLFAAVGVLFMVESGFTAVSVVSDMLGIVLGVVLGLVGASMTSFERRGAELHYKANVWIGSIVTALFIGRFAYRMYGIMTMPQDQSSYNFATGGSGWSSGLILIMFAYYVVYYAFLMSKGKPNASAVEIK